MEQAPIKDFLSEAIRAEEAYLILAAHPQVIAAHKAAISDFKKRLNEIRRKQEPILPG